MKKISPLSTHSDNVDQEHLCKEIEHMVLKHRLRRNTWAEEDIPDWEKELQVELQEYEVVADAEARNNHWDKELEEMRQEDL
ncbi:unnamed protein product [Lota lota]